MRILITTLYLNDPGGTQTYVAGLAWELVRRGHEVEVYSPHLGMISDELTQQGIPCYSVLPKLDFDIVHAHHRPLTAEILSERSGIPVVFVSHSVITEVECPPEDRAGIHHYVAISPEVKEHLVQTQGLERSRISVVYNGVDTDLFGPTPLPGLSDGLKILVLSNNPFPLPTLAEAVDLLPDLEPQVTVVGRSSQYWRENWGDRPGFVLQEPVPSTPALFHRHHLILTLGRGVLEAMSCARPVIVLDWHGADGLVTVRNVHEIKRHNFSGRRFRLRWTGSQLAAAIRWVFQRGNAQALADANRGLVTRHFGLREMAGRLLSIYTSVLAERPVPRCRTRSRITRGQDPAVGGVLPLETADVPDTCHVVMSSGIILGRRDS